MWKNTVVPVVVVSLFWLVMSGATSVYISWQDRSLNLLLEDNVTSIRAGAEMKATLWRMHTAALEAEQSNVPMSQTGVSQLEAQFLVSQTRATGAVESPEEKTLVEEIQRGFDEYRSPWKNVCLRQILMGSPKTSELKILMSLVTEPCDRLVQHNERLMVEATSKRQRFSTVVLATRSLILLIGPLIGLWLGFRLAQRLRSSITRISVQLQGVAGELEEEVGRIELSPQTDLPAIQQQLDAVATRISEVVTELQKARQDMLRSERLAAVGELAAGVAHELRNPMTSVKLLLQTVRHRPQQGIPERTLEILLEEINRMETTIQGLLDFARPAQLKRTRHDVRQTVQRAINLVDGRARQSQVVLQPHFGLTPAEVDGDAEQLHQVCVNLLLNGIESMSSGGAIDIGIEADSTAVRIRFADSGAGIASDILPRLFEPFVTNKERGTGLGLAISRRIVVSHDGRLTAANRPEGGAEFVIELPAEAAERRSA